MTKSLITAVFLIAASAAHAQSTSSSKPDDATAAGNAVTFPAANTFGKLDMNKDGKLSMDEFGKMELAPSSSPVSDIFNAWNTDKDDSISLEEFTAGSAPPVQSSATPDSNPVDSAAAEKSPDSDGAK